MGCFERSVPWIFISTGCLAPFMGSSGMKCTVVFPPYSGGKRVLRVRMAEARTDVFHYQWYLIFAYSPAMAHAREKNAFSVLKKCRRTDFDVRLRDGHLHTSRHGGRRLFRVKKAVAARPVGAKGSGKVHVFVFFVPWRRFLPQVIRKFVARTQEEPCRCCGEPLFPRKAGLFPAAGPPTRGPPLRRRTAHWRKPIQTNTYRIYIP